MEKDKLFSSFEYPIFTFKEKPNQQQAASNNNKTWHHKYNTANKYQYNVPHSRKRLSCSFRKDTPLLPFVQLFP